MTVKWKFTQTNKQSKFNEVARDEEYAFKVGIVRRTRSHRKKDKMRGGEI